MSRNGAIERSFEGPAWFAVWVHPGWERRVFRRLHDLEFSPYLPRQGDELLFAGYVFVLADACRDAWGKIRPKDHAAERCDPIVVGGVEMGQEVPASADDDETADTGIHGVGGLLCDDEGQPVPIPHMQLANPLYADILAEIKRISPFISNRKRKAEIKWKRHLAISRAS